MRLLLQQKISEAYNSSDILCDIVVEIVIILFAIAMGIVLLIGDDYNYKKDSDDESGEGRLIKKGEQGAAQSAENSAEDGELV